MVSTFFTPTANAVAHTHMDGLMISVFVRYPNGHHRHRVCPDWHAWGDQAIDPSEPGADASVAQTVKVAKSHGADVRVARCGTTFRSIKSTDGGSE